MADRRKQRTRNANLCSMAIAISDQVDEILGSDRLRFARAGAGCWSELAAANGIAARKSLNLRLRARLGHAAVADKRRRLETMIPGRGMSSSAFDEALEGKGVCDEHVKPPAAGDRRRSAGRVVVKRATRGDHKTLPYHVSRVRLTTATSKIRHPLASFQEQAAG